MELPDLSLLTLSFRLQAEKSLVLPPFLGSTLRGAFGKALKQVSCFAPPDEDCWFGDACVYRYVFESPNFTDVPRDAMHPKLRGQKQVPPPFVLIPPPLKKKSHLPIRSDSPNVVNLNDDYCSNSIKSGGTIEFSIVLIGRAVHLRTHILVAARLLAKNGLGKSGIAFKLTEAVAHDETGQPIRIFSHDHSNALVNNVAAVKLTEIVRRRVQTFTGELQEANENILRIRFVTPTSTRILLRGKNETTLRFGDLLKKITERLEFLAFLYGDPSQKVDYRPLLSKADDIRTINHCLKHYCYKQYSNRQKRIVPRDVFLGDVTYQSHNIREFLYYLVAAEILNVGSNVSAGLGSFIICQG